MNADETYCGQELRSELARYCLPAASRDANRKLAWMNSICILFLLIGVAGAKPATIRIKTPAPLEEAIPTIIEPPTPPPTRIEARRNETQEDTEKTAAPQMVAVTLETPAIHFAVPTVGNLVVPATLAQAPSIAPVQTFTPLRKRIVGTGVGGDRPDPPYPQMAQDLGQQGTVLLSMTVDENGGITGVEVKESSGSPLLDKSALDYVKRHWILPTGEAGRIYEAPIRYVLSQ